MCVCVYVCVCVCVCVACGLGMTMMAVTARAGLTDSCSRCVHACYSDPVIINSTVPTLQPHSPPTHFLPLISELVICQTHLPVPQQRAVEFLSIVDSERQKLMCIKMK